MSFDFETRPTEEFVMIGDNKSYLLKDTICPEYTLGVYLANQGVWEVIMAGRAASLSAPPKATFPYALAIQKLRKGTIGLQSFC